MSHRRAALYLQIPAAYCRAFGGLRWAQYGEAVEFLDGPDAGRTFAFAAEIGQFLEGLLVPGRPCPAFGSALHLLYLIGLGRRAEGKSPSPRLDRLARGFRELGSPLRNAGALCAWLYGDMPGVADPPELSALLELLNGGSWIPQMVLSHPMLGAMDYAEQPPVDVDALDERMGVGLRAMTDDEIRHWLKFGRGPLVPGHDLPLPLPPRGSAGSLADLEERPRLSGMTRLVERLEGALSLPPRRIELAELKSDGYWDLTTRGAPEQILPMQFALDDEEFLRRFAERELLYFHRETPSRPAARELVLVLDQGVRTWGDVRLVLAGAAMALARQAMRRKLDVRLATTGDEGTPRGAGFAGTRRRCSSPATYPPDPARTLARLLRDDPGSAARRRPADPPAQPGRARGRRGGLPARRRRSDPALRRLGRLRAARSSCPSCGAGGPSPSADAGSTSPTRRAPRARPRRQRGADVTPHGGATSSPSRSPSVAGCSGRSPRPATPGRDSSISTRPASASS